MAKRRKNTSEGRVPGDAIGELSDYFQHEDIGPPAVSTEPRAGTCSLDPKPPTWGPGVDAELMAVVYRRLCHAQRYMSKNIFTVLRTRYGPVLPADQHQRKVCLDDAHKPEQLALIEHAERLYAGVRAKFPRESRLERERRRLRAKEARIFGEPLK